MFSADRFANRQQETALRPPLNLALLSLSLAPCGAAPPTPFSSSRGARHHRYQVDQHIALIISSASRSTCKA